MKNARWRIFELGLLVAVSFGLALGLGLIARAQSALPDDPQSASFHKYQQSGYVPSSATALATRDVTVIYLRLFNDDATNTGEVRAVDGTTNCGGAACPLFDVTINAKQLYLIPMSNELVKGGVTWQSVGTSTKVVGFVKLQY